MSGENSSKNEHQRNAAAFMSEARRFMSAHYPDVIIQIENSTTRHIGTALGLSVRVKGDTLVPDILRQNITSTLSNRLNDRFQQTDVQVDFYADTVNELVNASKDLGDLGHQYGNSSISAYGEIVGIEQFDPEFQEAFHGKLFYKNTTFRFK